MKLFNLFNRSARRDAPTVPERPVFVREYQNSSTFRGMHRLPISLYGDDEAVRNCMDILGDEDEHMCKGQTITLAGFRFDGGTGIKVSVDGSPVGVVWEQIEDAYYESAYSGDIGGVFVRLSRDPDGSCRGNLFVK